MHLAGHVPAAGPARDLGQQLERPLARPEIGHVQAQIGVDDAHQRHVREMQPLGDHLRPDQDVDLPGPEVAQDPVVGVLARGHVRIHALDPAPGEALAARCVSTRCVPDAGKPERGIAASRAASPAPRAPSPQMWQRSRSSLRW